ncbi:hypothetical protein H2198_005869 [Neophaeococcomyces mojaviensis]|uniref:Uncharacterized protein n=1 Tax=Neophaeococcomyces mojaviensis TaxID=3383035 RepID=A0ACC3A4H8_9EURO|nr:hypothetical protein H2198_005869 [Knufia sp. JES_112]
MVGRASGRKSRKAAFEEEEEAAVITRDLSSSSVPKSTKTSLSKKIASNTRTPSSRKRKHIHLTQDDDDESALAPKRKSKASKKGQEEKRLRVFRARAPQTFLSKLERAQTQRMIVIGRSRHGRGPDLHEDIDIVGTTGNIYTVTIGRLPSCTCPDHQKGNECKHKVYALHTVLKAPAELQYQRAFLTSEVREILSGAPRIPNATGGSKEDNTGKRKPTEGECPICYMDLDPKVNELVWCKAACGNNMHKECFEQWAASQRGQEVRCVYCRTPWQMDKKDLDTIKKAGAPSGDGYINVAEQFGIERARDYSTYYRPWVRRTFGYG